jgi:hypothetical protein
VRERRETADKLLMDNYELETAVNTLQKDAVQLKSSKTSLQLELDAKYNKEQQLLQAGALFIYLFTYLITQDGAATETAEQ